MYEHGFANDDVGEESRHWSVISDDLGGGEGLRLGSKLQAASSIALRLLSGASWWHWLHSGIKLEASVAMLRREQHPL